VAKIAPSVVQIETSGGTEIISTGPRGRPVRKGIGPTTGLIVSPDGYIISSAFNFANKPSSVIVAVAGKPERFVAKIVATDQTRMLTLLKINDVNDLPVPVAVPRKEIQIGQTAIAVGRTEPASINELPSVSEGIISAVGRIWGKAVQTDAKISPTNYGGPLVDLAGRVQGVLVPASPNAEGETAGVEWYDSGIGFAIPLEDINAVLPRLKKGEELKRGILGITMEGGDIYAVPPKVSSIAPDSAADKGGLQTGDVIVAIDDVAVNSQAQLRHQLGGKYEGDTITVKVQRDKEEKTFKVALAGAGAAASQSFLGILPLRDDDKDGVEIRHVYPKSPAEEAKPGALKPGDRITHVVRNAPAVPPGAPRPPGAMLKQPIKNRDALQALLAGMAPGTEVKFDVVRKEGKKTETVTVKLGELPTAVPDKLPDQATAKKAKAPESAPMKPETGLLKKTTPAADHRFWVYVPETYDPTIAHALVIWLHPVGKKKDTDLEDFILAWQDYCEDHNIILLLPIAEAEQGWTPSDSEFIEHAVKTVTDGYTVDARRVVAHGMGIGGQMAFYLGYHSRTLIRGVAVTGASLTSTPKERVANRPLAFYIIAGGKDPLKDSIQESHKKIAEFKYPSIYREIPNMGHQYLDLATLEELVRWVDSLDLL
jgi:S1-C subfamily serine protease